MSSPHTPFAAVIVAGVSARNADVHSDRACAHRAPERGAAQLSAKHVDGGGLTDRLDGIFCVEDVWINDRAELRKTAARRLPLGLDASSHLKAVAVHIVQQESDYGV